MSVPPQLQPLVDLLPDLTLSQLHTVLASGMQEGAPAEFTACMEEAMVNAERHASVLSAAKFLIRQAGKVPIEKLAPRLKPVGFSTEHLDVLAAVLAGSAALPAVAVLKEADDAELTPMQMARQQLGFGSDDESDKDDTEDEDEDEDDDAPGLDMKELMPLVTETQLKVILRCTAQHCAGMVFDSATCDALEHVLRECGFKPAQAPSVLKIFSETIRTRADGQNGREALYTLGQGHAILIKAASKWWNKHKQALSNDSNLQKLLGSDIAGWLEVNGWAGSGKASATWSRKYLKITRFGLEVFPSMSDATAGIRGPEYSVVPKALLEPPKKGIDALVPKSVKESRSFAFSIRITDASKVQGAPLAKVLLLDACNADAYGAWTNTLTAVLSGDRDGSTGRVVVAPLQSFDSLPAQTTSKEEAADVETQQAVVATVSEPEPSDDRATLDKEDETGEGGMETWTEVLDIDNGAAVVPPQRRTDLGKFTAAVPSSCCCLN